jgi:hypothetical protein
VTDNLTCGGFFCLSGEVYLPGDELQATLELPAPRRNGYGGHLTLQCQVEVVRIKGLAEQSGVACRIRDYTVITAPT